MLLKIHYKKTETVWMKDDFSPFEIVQITKKVKNKIPHIEFNLKKECFVCKNKKEYNIVYNTIFQYSKNKHNC